MYERICHMIHVIACSLCIKLYKLDKFRWQIIFHIVLLYNSHVTIIFLNCIVSYECIHWLFHRLSCSFFCWRHTQTQLWYIFVDYMLEYDLSQVCINRTMLTRFVRKCRFNIHIIKIVSHLFKFRVTLILCNWWKIFIHVY
jgi:hypothetical protein